MAASKEPASKTIVMRAAGSYSNVARALAASSKRPGNHTPNRSAPPSFPGMRLRTRQKPC